MVNGQKDFITAYKVTCTEPRFAEALERRFLGFVGNEKHHAARREAFEITREGFDENKVQGYKISLRSL